MTLTQKSGHLAWCALAALALARQDGTVSSAAQENLFLTRWLATALKQRRFSREVAPDIEWLLKQGRQYGVAAKLAGKLDYLWRSCTGKLSQQNDLFRLTYALEMAKDMCWAYRLLSDREWSGRHSAALNAGVNGIYLSRTSLDAAFDNDGQQVTPVMARLTGRVQGLETLLNRCGWQMAVDGPSGLYELTAEKGEETVTKEK
ncbi:hypothetical protein FHW11_004391 [Pantoea agglomerans]|uniref:DUF2913 family protein n=1 Tax=Enterobacter agglomerans TaxID=549 RepID=UPI0015F9AB25|nr:DUF2913 family protein [Pantoea agglomerans]MBA8867202.1 hypothetical protein [Pantoea agglomerans]MBA8894243.1 hypothetical protein [Pantoea agglomerans]